MQVNPSFQKPPLLKLPLNQTQHFEVFKINKKFSFIIINIQVISLQFITINIIISHLGFFEKYSFEINIMRFKIKVIKLAINIGVDEIL